MCVACCHLSYFFVRPSQQCYTYTEIDRFFFVFCLQVLLFLVLDLAVESGATAVNAEFHFGNIIGVVLAMITFVIAFTEALVIAGHYIVDTWNGHFLAKQFVFKKLSATAVDWVFFVFFLFAPLIIMCISLFMRLPNWWEITGKMTIGERQSCTSRYLHGNFSHEKTVVILLQLWLGSPLSWPFTFSFVSVLSFSKLILLGISARIETMLTVTIGSLY